MSKVPFVILVIVSTASLALADDEAPQQDSAKQAAAVKIGIVDVNHLFRNHAALKKQMADLQAEGMLIQAKFESELKSLRKKSEDLKDIAAGSLEYKKLEEQLVKRKANIEAEVALKRKEFEQREALVYADVYKQIKVDVAKLAKSKHLTVVMNANLEEIDSANPTDVARGISNKLVWYDNSIDLTPQLEKAYSAALTPAAGDKQRAVAVNRDRASSQRQADVNTR